MLKIIYALSKRKDAYTQLYRFLKAIEHKNYHIKIAAYRDLQNPQLIDWTLDALLNMFDTERISFNNDNLEVYYDQIKYFDPDLVISDLEPFTSYIAETLNITTWQVSPSLIYHAIDDKYNLGIHKNFSYLFRKQNIEQRNQNIIYNAEKRFVYSHFCDVENFLPIKNGFEWIRPYHIIGQESKACKHDAVCIAIDEEKRIAAILKKRFPNDLILFSKFSQEKYLNVTIKNLQNYKEYACNLKNCEYFFNQGFTTYLADGFYNNKFSWIFPNFLSEESIINYTLSEKYKIGKALYEHTDLSNIDSISPPAFKYSSAANFLHEKIEEYELRRI